MKLLRLTSVYSGYSDRFYAAHPDLPNRSYEEQSRAFFHDAFAWADSWKAALRPIGYEVEEIVLNLAPMQQAWAREHLPRPAEADLHAIAIEQIKRFGPDVLWFDENDAALLQRIRDSVPGIRLTLGWTGSALAGLRVAEHCDLMLSCSREAVERLKQAGHRAAELHHGFDQRILTRLRARQENHDLIFIGQLVRGHGFHAVREKLLEELVQSLPLHIFSPSAESSRGSKVKRLIRQALSHIYRFAQVTGAGGAARWLLKAVGRDEDWLRPPAPVNSKLRPHMSGGIYGLQMYQAICDSKVTLNIHADSSDQFASNMRLFEVTGVGGCLLTDWKPNIPELFVPDEEVVAYRSPAEGIEKARWLLANPGARQAIARAGQARTLGHYTFSHRAPQLDEIIRNAVRNQRGFRS